MPQTGPDLVGAGYPISNALTALLGGNSNATSPNVPVYSNLYFGGVSGGLTDVALAGTASVNAVAVPIVPGAVISTMTFLVGGASAASPTFAQGMLFTGTGSAPGTTNAQPVLIGSTGSAGNVVAASPSSARYTLTFGTPQTITSTQAPFGFIYAAFEMLFSGGSATFISMTASASGQYPWYSTSPYTLYGTSASVTGFATLGTTTRQPNPPVVLLA
jgi:hypothetical protein